MGDNGLYVQGCILIQKSSPLRTPLSRLSIPTPPSTPGWVAARIVLESTRLDAGAADRGVSRGVGIATLGGEGGRLAVWLPTSSHGALNRKQGRGQKANADTSVWGLAVKMQARPQGMVGLCVQSKETSTACVTFLVAKAMIAISRLLRDPPAQQ